MTQEICAPLPETFAFDALPVSVETIQAHIQEFFPIRGKKEAGFSRCY